jgi:DNA-binding LacI/PurR family transcriptional regulator
MSVSIKDIARAACVSHSTVSRALADSPLVSAATKARIEHLAHQMGYSPDAQARSLVMGRTMTVGVVVTSITDPFIAEVVQGIERTAHDHGYSVILAGSGADRERELAAVEMLRSKRVDGLIVTSSRVGSLYQHHLERLGVPVVLVNSHSQRGGRYTFSISVDNRHGGWLATRHLIELGHRRIAYVTGPAGRAAAPSLGSAGTVLGTYVSSDDQDRLAGHRQALEEAGVSLDPALVVPGTGAARGGGRALAQLWALDSPPTAAFCYNDMTAIGLLHAARRLGLSIPGDLAVVGFDDVPFASYALPPLTTVAQPVPEMGQRAMEMALALMQNGNSGEGAISDVVLRGRLIVRQSSGARKS